MSIVTALLPVFSRFTAKDLSWTVSGLVTVVIGLVAITLFTGLVAGSYPALFLSSFQPVKVLRGSLKSGAASSRFRKILVVLQFSLSVLLIIGTIVVYRQLNFMQEKRLGWDREHLVYIPLGMEVKKSYEVLRNELAKDPHVLGVTATSELPSHIGSNSGGADWEGKDPELQTLIGQCVVDYDFIDTRKIELAGGRSFSREYTDDNGKTVIVNCSAATRVELVGEPAPLDRPPS